VATSVRVLAIVLSISQCAYYIYLVIIAGCVGIYRRARLTKYADRDIIRSMATTRNPRVTIRLRELCAEHKVTSYRVAASINRKNSTLHDVISGRRGISEDLLVDLCDYFQCEVGDLIKIRAPEAEAGAIKK